MRQRILNFRCWHKATLLTLVGRDTFDFAMEFVAVNRAPSAATAPFFPSATIPLSATHFFFTRIGSRFDFNGEMFSRGRAGFIPEIAHEIDLETQSTAAELGR